MIIWKKIPEYDFGKSVIDEYDLGDMMIVEKAFPSFKQLYLQQRNERKYMNPLFSKLDTMDRNDIDGFDKIENFKSKKIWHPHKKEISPNAEDPEAGSKQEKFNLNYNYNFEEYRVYTREFNKAKLVNTQKEEQQNKLLAYIKTNPESREAKKFKYTNFIPLERINFQIESIDPNWKPEQKSDHKKIRLDKHSNDISEYDAWRTMTETIPYSKSLPGNARKIKLSPGLS